MKRMPTWQAVLLMSGFMLLVWGVLFLAALWWTRRA